MDLRGRAPVFGVVLALLAGCGTNGPVTDASADGMTGGASCPIDMNRRIADLTAAERRTICDCSAAIGGGYGKTTKCANGLEVKTPADQATCLANPAVARPSCTATVADALGCASEVHQVCTPAGPRCQALLACYSADGGT